MNTIYKILISIIALVLLSGVACAVDNAIPNAIGINTYQSAGTDYFILINNNASNGFVDSSRLNSLGYLTPRNVFLENGNNILDAKMDPTTANQAFGTDEAGNVFRWNTNILMDYSHGFYACCDLFGNPTNSNPLYKIGTLSAATFGRKITLDSSGNVYVADGLTIYKYTKSSGYVSSSIITLSSGNGLPAHNPALITYHIMDTKMTSDGKMVVLSAAYNICPACGDNYNVVKTLINSDLSIDHYKIIVTTDLLSNSDPGVKHGQIILDTTNQTNNMTIAYETSSGATKLGYLIHTSNGTNTNIAASPLTGITSMGGIEYYNHNILYASYSDNIVRAYATNYEGVSLTSGAPTNPDGITGTFRWLDGYGATTTTITPGQAMAYTWTISNELSNYTFYTGWGTDMVTQPGNIHDLTVLTGLAKPAVFPSSSNDVAGTTIYGYILAKRNNDSTWSQLFTPQPLTITMASVGYDSITLDKNFYNLTGDTITATFTYASGYPYIYKWQICSRVDCADGLFFNQISLIGSPSTSSMSTTGMEQGNYYAVLMNHLPIITDLSNQIVASQRFEVRPPVVGVSWDKPSYNLFPKSQVSTCLDATPSYFPWTNVSGYAGLQYGWFSCSTTPAEANANNSMMRGSLYAKYNGTFYLNNSLGNIWNGSLYNGSGALIYTLTNSSVTGTWTLTGVNQSNDTYVANTEVEAESAFGYSLSVSPNPAYNQDTLYMTFTKPIWIDDYVVMKDAGGTTVFTSGKGQTSGTYYIDPSKQYTYGTWTAYWNLGSIGSVKTQGQHIYTFTVKNAGRPTTNNSVVPENSAEYTNTEITNLLSSKIFWALLFIIGIMLAISTRERRGK